ncbi:hypothetical protein NDU88_005207 [Pleurodeles waltl]|uniref:Uncharacterized protein n=1 Tax=Pleurodeles waltl TaxID=8319 RepID=A0AAV7NLU3_PLEWA|nr:hypothetical protein NDU88_005207 [Pleurodeles waltl]
MGPHILRGGLAETGSVVASGPRRAVRGSPTSVNRLDGPHRLRTADSRPEAQKEQISQPRESGSADSNTLAKTSPKWAAPPKQRQKMSWAGRLNHDWSLGVGGGM